MNNNAILNAGKTKPTIGTKIAGKNEAVILFYKIFFNYKFLILIVYEKNLE